MLNKHENQNDYFHSLDDFQKNLFETLNETYSDETFCKLMAVKVANFFASDYHFHHRHAKLSSNPIQLLIDPSNGCQLQCPGCVHTGNKSVAEKFDWPNRSLPFKQYNEFLARYGVFASAAILYNYGEPLLHKRFSDMVRTAKEYLLFTMTSSNFSLKINADELVLSGLDYLLLSIDGASQETYQQYRRQGQFQTVIDNIKSIVEAKKRLKKDKPYLVWSYLTFEHNIDEVDKAIEMAEYLGVNEIQISTPFSVSWDDPSVKVAISPKQGRVVFKPVNINSYTEDERQAISQWASQIDTAYKASWGERLMKLGDKEEPSHTTASSCRWLYHNLTLDGASRIMPCCAAPTMDKKARNLVYAHFEGHNSNIINSASAVLSRQALADPETFTASTANRGATELPYCITCNEQPSPAYGFNQAAYLHAVDSRNSIPAEIYADLEQCALYKI